MHRGVVGRDDVPWVAGRVGHLERVRAEEGEEGWVRVRDSPPVREQEADQELADVDRVIESELGREVRHNKHPEVQLAQGR